MIYLTLLSTTCVKIHQILYAIFETISHFSRHNSFAFFSSKITYFHPIKVQIGRLSTAPVKIHKIPWVIFQIKVSVSSKSRSFSVSWEIILLYFLAETLHAIDKSNTSRYKFQTCQCSHQNPPNYSCHFWNQESVLLQTLYPSSLSWEITLMYFFI